MRGMLSIVAVALLVISQLPNNRTTAAASDGVTYAGAVAINDVAPTADPCPVESEPLTVCTEDGCYPVASGPVRSVVRTTTRVVTAPVRAVAQRQVYRSNERFMQRGPARRFAGRVGCAACRVVTAPIRWLRR